MGSKAECRLGKALIATFQCVKEAYKKGGKTFYRGV